MDINELRRHEHLSASSVATYLECGLAFRFRYLDHARAEFRPEALVFGSAVHEALAAYYLALAEGQRLDQDELLEVFVTSLRRVTAGDLPVQYKQGHDYDSLLKQGQEMLSVFHREIIDDQAEIVGVEMPFSLAVPGLPVPVIGVYDLVLRDADGVITIVDHKTAARAYSATEVDGNFQLTLYQVAARANGLADDEVLLRLDCLLKTKQPRFEQFYTTRNDLQEHMAVRRVLAAWEGVSKGVFLPAPANSWKCAGCVHPTACRQWFEARQAS